MAKNTETLKVLLSDICSNSLLASQVAKHSKQMPIKDRENILKALKQIQKDTAESIAFLEALEQE